MLAITVGLFAFVLVALYFYLANWVGEAAEAKGRSRFAWTGIALVFGLVLPAVIVACWQRPSQA